MKKIMLSVLMIGSSLSWCDVKFPMHDAVRRNDVETIQKLILNSADINVRDKFGFTPLHLAAMYNNSECSFDAYFSAKLTTYLISAGADIHARDKNGRTSLHIAAHYDSKDTVQCLIAAGADINARDNDGNLPILNQSRTRTNGKFLYSAMDDAISKDDIQTVKKLIVAGADINGFYACPGFTYKVYRTPLQQAVRNCRIKTVQYLLSVGADVNQVTQKERTTALHLVAYLDEIPTMLTLMYISCSNRLPEDIFDRKNYYAGRVEVAQCLFAAGADINVSDESGKTPLHGAAVFGDLELVKYLISVGADIHVRDEFGNTPLHMASGFANINVAIYLTSVGADVKARNNKGQTPDDVLKNRLPSTADLAMDLLDRICLWMKRSIVK